MGNRILTPTDGSEPAGDAIRLAIQMAGKLGLSLVALRVVDVDRYASEFMAIRETVSRDLEEQAQRILAEAKSMTEDTGIEMETLVRHGDSSREIIRFAQENSDVVLIIMGASGRRRLGRQLIGSTAERVVRQVGRDLPCAVMIAPCRVCNPDARLELMGEL